MLNYEKDKCKFKFVVEKTSTGYSAYCTDESIFTTGESIAELNYNILEATNLHIEESGQIATMKDLKIQLDIAQLFEYLKVINAKHLANRIGMNESLLNQYVKGKKKPSVKQLNRILEGIHQVGNELKDINLIGV